MKIFDSENSPWDSKVNFVDSNNVLVGYDMSQCCCENAGWFITEKPTPYSFGMEQLTLPNLEEYVFDIDFFENLHSEDLDSGGIAIFRLTAPGKPDLYLHLYNSHNGYYSHGFEMQQGEKVIKEDYL